MKQFVFIGLIAVAALVGCDKKAVPPAPTPMPAPVAARGQLPEPTHAQGTLPTIHLWIGPEDLTAEMARTDEQVMTGMMFRTNLDEMKGMIFVFPGAWRPGFWMKNCPLPLSCAYINPDGTIAEIHPLNANDTNAVVADSNQIQFVLEVNQGWFDRHHIKPGTVVRTQVGTLLETFIRRNQ
ncbi:MAG TPA: DUF192 domain-containing protein [Verrucomicrobiae bacterium]